MEYLKYLYHVTNVFDKNATTIGTHDLPCKNLNLWMFCNCDWEGSSRSKIRGSWAYWQDETCESVVCMRYSRMKRFVQKIWAKQSPTWYRPYQIRWRWLHVQMFTPSTVVGSLLVMWLYDTRATNLFYVHVHVNVHAYTYTHVHHHTPHTRWLSPSRWDWDWKKNRHEVITLHTSHPEGLP